MRIEDKKVPNGFQGFTHIVESHTKLILIVFVADFHRLEILFPLEAKMVNEILDFEH